MRHATHDARPRFSALSSAIAETFQSALATARRPQAIGVSGIIVTSALAVALPAVTRAQEPAGAAPVEEVTVTGSRIRRQDFSANAPVVSIDEAM
ncbi:MAG TPA: hypothetical protein VF405_11355, partial [Gammaproteobacteria bacterium]